jgi:glycosyltransferase involved in cell wall biosynthesis
MMTKNPAVLILINVRWWNATAFYAVNIARILHKNGYNVFVGCDPDYPAYKKTLAYGLRPVPLSFYGYHPLKLIKSFIAMLRLIKQERIDILNPHRAEDHFFALLAKLITGCFVVVTRGDQRKIKKGLLSYLKYRFSDAVIVTCKSIAAQNQHIFKAMMSKLAVIYGSVDEQHFEQPVASFSSSSKLNGDTNQLTIGLVGRISHIKGQETFIKAAAIALRRFQNIRFIISGKEVGTKISQLRVKARELGVEKKMILLTEVPRVSELIYACDICVSASVSSETISRIVLEYLYMGKPVIGTAINAVSEIILPGINGELFAPYDHEELAAAILKLVQDPKLRKKYAQNSRELYRTYYSESIFFNNYHKVLTRFYLNRDSC